MEDELQEMKQTLEELKKKYVEAVKVDENFKRKVNEHPDIIQLIVQQKELADKRITLWEKHRNAEEKIVSLFTKDGRFPQFTHKTPSYDQYTNIKNEVLDTIIETIGKLYLLKRDDIIQVVANLIQMEIEKHPELHEYEKEVEVAEKQIREIERKESDLRKELTKGWDNTSYDLADRIKKLERDIKDYANDGARQKREEKTRQLHNKAREYATAEAIYKKLRSGQ